MKKTLKAGFIGCGSIARIKHLPAALQQGQIVPVAFYDTNRSNAESLLAQSGNPDGWIADTPEQILDDTAIDFVYVCTPNCYHAPLTISALEHKKHVVCEKPMASVYDDAVAMHLAAVRNDRVLYIAYQNRFTDHALYVKSLCEAGFFGKIFHAEAYAVRSRAIPTWGVFTDRQIQGGGPVIDVATHSIDLVLWLTENYAPSYTCGMTYDYIMKNGSDANRWGPWDVSKVNVEDSAFAFVCMEDGMTVSVKTAWAMNTTDERMSSFALYGDQGGVEFRDGKLCLIHEIGGRMCRTTPIFDKVNSPMTPLEHAADPTVREASAYAYAMLYNSAVTENGDKALVVSKIVDAVYRSATERKPIYF